MIVSMLQPSGLNILQLYDGCNANTSRAFREKALSHRLRRHDLNGAKGALSAIDNDGNSSEEC